MNISGKKLKAYITIIAVIFTIYIINVFLHPPIYLFIMLVAMGLLIFIIVSKKNFIALFGNLYLVHGEVDKGLELIKKAIDMNTTNVLAYLNYSIVVLRDGDWESSLALVEKAEKLSPDIITYKNLMLTKGSCYWVSGDIKKAIEVLEGLRAKYSYVNEQVLTTLAYMYYLDNKLIIALEITKKAIEIRQDYAPAWDNIGQIYYKGGDIIMAKEAFKKAISLNPGLVDSTYFLGEIYEREGKIALAQKMFEKASNCDISALNTVAKNQITDKINKYIASNIDTVS